MDHTGAEFSYMVNDINNIVNPELKQSLLLYAQSLFLRYVDCRSSVPYIKLLIQDPILPELSKNWTEVIEQLKSLFINLKLLHPYIIPVNVYSSGCLSNKDVYVYFDISTDTPIEECMHIILQESIRNIIYTGIVNASIFSYSFLPALPEDSLIIGNFYFKKLSENRYRILYRTDLAITNIKLIIENYTHKLISIFKHEMESGVPEKFKHCV